MANISLKLGLYTLAVATLCVFGIVEQGNAYGLLPNDTKQIYLDVHSGTSGTLLTATSVPRTVLYVEASFYGNDAHICVNATSTCSANPSTDKLIDTEDKGHFQNFVPHLIPAGQPLGWNKSANNDKFSMNVAYVDYDISLIPENAVSTSTVQDVNIVGGSLIINSSSTIATSSYKFDIATTTLKDSTSNVFGLTTNFIGYIFGAWWQIIIAIGFCIGMAVFFFKKSNPTDYD